MECKFLSNGIAIQNDGVVKPCCAWQYDGEWVGSNHYTKFSSLNDWHQKPELVKIRSQLEAGIWPTQCVKCQVAEQNGHSSMRENSISAYENYNKQDITMEIRPGNVCNFACQSCWPAASSRVASFMHRAGIVDRSEIEIESIQNFDFLNSVTHRIRDVIVLGGEPFYDKHCKKFLEWAINNLSANIMIFTNGLYIDYEFIENYSSKITLIFSLDAVNRPAEYIRFGTEWHKVFKNYQKCKSYNNIELRVNITMSVYNLLYVDDLLEILSSDWPDLVTFGHAFEYYLTPLVVPLNQRQVIIEKLSSIFEYIEQGNIPEHQKQNTTRNIQSVIDQLQTGDYDYNGYNYLCNYIEKMDTVKNIKLQDYCPELYKILF